ncbi:MAG: CpsB/CapC family capsule biosynthesis tyrosine phosphatase [Planctomycetota bacterium]|jgi:protein-tyrosine phosphatase|nr:hypothetical protein [Planctomycetia bacterium]MDO7677103.1 hypothetical protein [Pirellulales bacterium]
MSLFTDIHCHIVPCIDDGATNLAESIAMATMAIADGTSTIIATPHQLGSNKLVTAVRIRQGIDELNRELAVQGIALKVLPGADVRIEPELPKLLRSGDVLTLADKGLHVLLELPHEIYFPLEPLLSSLNKQGLIGILSHPERNRGILAKPSVLESVVDAGGLIQITAGSLTGSFGESSQRLAKQFVRDRMVHFVASDAHDTKRRPFGLSEAFHTVCELADKEMAECICCENPARVAAGDPIQSQSRSRSARATRAPKRSWFGMRAL